jgi:hypothetical protein
MGGIKTGIKTVSKSTNFPLNFKNHLALLQGAARNRPKQT